jgi:hypothetical protein
LRTSEGNCMKQKGTHISLDGGFVAKLDGESMDPGAELMNTIWLRTNAWCIS